MRHKIVAIFAHGLFAATLLGCPGNECDPSKTFPEQGACSDQNIPSGEIGGPCNDFGTPCPGGKCITGACHECGEPGQPCCGGPSPSCDPGVTCGDENANGVRMCIDGCGDLGESCCSNGNVECQEGMWCIDNTNTCEPAPLASTCEGANQYALALRFSLSKCAADPWWVKADSEAEALQCTAADLVHPDPTQDLEVVSVETTAAAAAADAYEYCPEEGAFGPLTVYAHSEADAWDCLTYLQCAVNMSDCPWTAC